MSSVVPPIQHPIEEFIKLSTTQFSRDDWIGNFQFNMICMHCKFCDPSCLPYTDRHLEPPDFPRNLPLDRVIHLKCQHCNETKMRFRVTV